MNTKTKYFFGNTCIFYSAYYWLVKDGSTKKYECTPEENLMFYIKDAGDAFKKRLDGFISSKSITTLDEHKMRAMLESIINAKHVWQEEYEMNLIKSKN